MNRLKELRKEKSLTQQCLADEIGVTKRTIIAWEKEEREIKSGKAKQLADFFGVSVGYLLGYDSQNKDKKDRILTIIQELKQYRHLLVSGEVYISEGDVIEVLKDLL